MFLILRRVFKSASPLVPRPLECVRMLAPDSAAFAIPNRDRQGVGLGGRNTSK